MLNEISFVQFCRSIEIKGICVRKTAQQKGKLLWLEDKYVITWVHMHVIHVFLCLFRFKHFPQCIGAKSKRNLCKQKKVYVNIYVHMQCLCMWTFGNQYFIFEPYVIIWPPPASETPFAIVFFFLIIILKSDLLLLFTFSCLYLSHTFVIFI